MTSAACPYAYVYRILEYIYIYKLALAEWAVFHRKILTHDIHKINFPVKTTTTTAAAETRNEMCHVETQRALVPMR